MTPICVKMMFALMLYFLYAVSAQTSSQYSRNYLRGLKKLENERITEEFINRGFTYIENAVLSAAKQGLLKYKTEPFEGCETYGKSSDDKEVYSFAFDKETCENIVNGIQKLVYERFPDSEVQYNTKTKRYILRWD
jgi:hypothetical protein